MAKRLCSCSLNTNTIGFSLCSPLAFCNAALIELRGDACIVVMLQTRTARLAFQLAETGSWANSLTATGGVQAAVQILRLLNPGNPAAAAGHKGIELNNTSALQLVVLKLLLRFTRVSAVAAAVLGRTKQLMDWLVHILLDAGVASVAGAGKAKTAADKTSNEPKSVSISAITKYTCMHIISQAQLFRPPKNSRVCFLGSPLWLYRTTTELCQLACTPTVCLQPAEHGNHSTCAAGSGRPPEIPVLRQQQFERATGASWWIGVVATAAARATSSRISSSRGSRRAVSR